MESSIATRSSWGAAWRVLAASAWACMLLVGCPNDDAGRSGESGTSEAPVDFEAVHRLRSETQRNVIRDFFGGRRGGVFVDVGAAHYRDLSMTYFLEKDFGWSGIAIDALPHWAAGYAEHRPATRFFQYIVTDHGGAEEPFYRIQGDIGSTARKDRADEIHEEWSKEVEEILVPTTTLDDLLERAGIAKIDFLSMDIEGHEPTALAGFAIERFAPELVGIEAFPENQEVLLAYFESRGYRRIDAYLERHDGDWFFTCEVRAHCQRVEGSAR